MGTRLQPETNKNYEVMWSLKMSVALKMIFITRITYTHLVVFSCGKVTGEKLMKTIYNLIMKQCARAQYALSSCML